MDKAGNGQVVIQFRRLQRSRMAWQFTGKFTMKTIRLMLASIAAAILLNACATPADSSGAVPEGHYRVQRGDNLYRIGLRFGQSVSTLAAWNNLRDPSQIEVGQILRVRRNATVASGSRTTSQPTPAATTPRPTAPTTTPAATNNVRLAHWPAEGDIITSFNGTTSKGIDIAGRAGSPVKAAADGRVSYAGEGVRGYGKLILLDHGNGLITAYAHNQSIAVSEGTRVRAGQTIAAMGNTGTDRVKLHFEVRQANRPLNPVNHLPSR